MNKPIIHAQTKLYASASKERCWDIAIEVGLSEEAQQMFRHAGTEFVIQGNVYEDGSFEPTHLDGRKLEEAK